MFFYKFVTLCLLGAPSLLGAEPLPTLTPSPEPDGRIVGGEFVFIEDYPHTVGYHWTNKAGKSEFCHGSIVSNQYIVTVAHCVDEINDFASISLRVGTSDRTKGPTVEVKDIIIHPNYVKDKDFSMKRMSYDVAMIRTERLQFSKSAKPVALPLLDVKELYALIITGWGSTSPKGPQSPHLRFVWLKAWDHIVCNSFYALTLTSEMFCAADTMKGICKGDDGAPAVEQRDDDNVLMGLALFQRGCGTGVGPAVFLRVSAPAIYNFIKNTMENKG